jgi:hypothetical protein
MCSFFLCLSCALNVFLLSEKTPLERIEKRIGVKVPTNANYLSYYTEGGEIFYLTFELPLNQGDEFASHFCDGQLIQGFNPFRGISLPPYSPVSPTLTQEERLEIYAEQGTTELEFGLTCSELGLLIQLVIDRRNGIDQVRFLMDDW